MAGGGILGGAIGGGSGSGSLFSTLGDIVNIVGSINTHDKEANRLIDIERGLKVPAALTIAETILKQKTNEGISGVDAMKNNIEQKGVVTLNKAKDFLTSGGMLDFLAKSSEQEAQQEQSLGMKNAEEKKSNLANYANFEGNTMAPAQQNLMDQKNQLKAGIAGIEADKSASIYKNINNIMGVSGDFAGKEMDQSIIARILKKQTRSKMPISDIMGAMTATNAMGGDENMLSKFLSIGGEKAKKEQKANELEKEYGVKFNPDDL